MFKISGYCVRISFNRYMVECEFLIDDKVPKSNLCFNRYMVECE